MRFQFSSVHFRFSFDRQVHRPSCRGRQIRNLRKKKTGFGSTFLGWKDMATAAAVMFQHTDTYNNNSSSSSKTWKKRRSRNWLDLMSEANNHHPPNKSGLDWLYRKNIFFFVHDIWRPFVYGRHMYLIIFDIIIIIKLVLFSSKKKT